MIRREWKSLLKNKWLLIVIIAIMAIPAIYTSLFLGSMWDPYGKVDNLPVAVVNNDKAVVFQGNSLNIGSNLVENLKKNQSLCFNFVDNEQASRGLKNGTYYMIIEIPEDFSANAATLLDEKPKKMELDFETNPGTNYIAMKMSETASSKIKTSVAQEVTKTYSESIFKQLADVGNGMQQAADGSSQLLTGTEKLTEGNKTITENLQTLAESSLTFVDGTNKLNSGLKSYTGGVASVNTGNSQLVKGSDELNAGAGGLNDGIKSLYEGLQTYTDGVDKTAQGTDQLKTNSGKLLDGMNQLTNGVNQLKKGTSDLSQGANLLSNTLQKDIPASDDIEQLKRGLDDFKTGINGLNTKVSAVSIPAIDKSSITKSLTSIGGSSVATGTNLQKISADLEVLNSADLTDSQKLALSDLVKNIGDIQTNTKTIGENTVILKTQLTGLDDIEKNMQSISELKTGVATLNGYADKLLPNSKTAISGMYDGLVNVQSSVDDKLVTGMTKLNAGVTQLDIGINGISGDSNNPGLKNGLKSYTDGVEKIDSGLNQLSGNSQQLRQGLSKLQDGSNTLVLGTQQLKEGIAAVFEGTNQLITNNNTLLDGMGKLCDGANQFSTGANQLKTGSDTLGNGITELNTGTNTLSTSLAAGAEKVNAVKTNDDTNDMLSNPVISKEKKITNVENNGHAMAAYMMSVGLWVAGIAFSIMYPLSKYEGTLKSGFAWWISKASVILPVSIIQALTMLFVLHEVNGFTPNQWGNTILISCLASLAFMAIMYFFNIFFGKVGSFAMLIFMVVQLAGSAGTYPVELSGGFVAKIHKWLPFSYTVDGFRSTIAGGRSITKYVVVLVLLAIVFTALTIAVFRIRAKRIKEGKLSIYTYLEEKGLA